MSAALCGRDAVAHALEAARKAGAAAADAVAVESDSVEVRVREAEIDHVKQARERGLGIRAFVDGTGALSSAVTSTSDLTPATIERMAAETVALARATAPDPCAGLPDGGFASDAPDLGLFDPADRAATVADRIDRAREAEAAARGADPRIANSEGSEASSDFAHVAFGNTSGLLAEYETAHHGISCMPVAKDASGMQTDYWMSVGRRLADLEAPADVGREAARRALGRLGARRVRTAEVPVIFDPMTARSLLANLVGCLSGYAVYREASFLSDRLGDAIASERVTVVDDGRRPGGLGSKPFDGEGLPTRRNLVVDGGRLASWLLDTYSARKLGAASTGNASRGVGSGPGVGATNLWLEPGDATLDEIVADTPRGLLVTGLFGHGFNAVTGDFSRGAAGLWIENGERTHPVEEITIAGNLGRMLLDVDAVGSDLLWLGRVAAPSLRVTRMTVAGE
jgi:PmbA protein